MLSSVTSAARAAGVGGVGALPVAFAAARTVNVAGSVAARAARTLASGSRSDEDADSNALWILRRLSPGQLRVDVQGDEVYISSGENSFVTTVAVASKIRDKLMGRKEEVAENQGLALEEALSKGFDRDTGVGSSGLENRVDPERVQDIIEMVLDSAKSGLLDVYNPNDGHGCISFAAWGDMTGESGQRVVKAVDAEAALPFLVLSNDPGANHAFWVVWQAVRDHKAGTAFVESDS